MKNISDEKLVFFVDLDNTLLDNDHVKHEIKKALINVLGKKEAIHFWNLQDEFRTKTKLVDFPKIIHKYCAIHHEDTCDLTLSRIFQNIDFKHALFPKSYEIINYLKKFGKVILFTEGDRQYQKRKIVNTGIDKLVDEVLLYERKLDHISDLKKRFKAYRKIFIDDRSESLKKLHSLIPNIKSIEVCQGHYGGIDHVKHKEMGITVDNISDILKLNREDLL